MNLEEDDSGGEETNIDVHVSGRESQSDRHIVTLDYEINRYVFCDSNDLTLSFIEVDIILHPNN